MVKQQLLKDLKKAVTQLGFDLDTIGTDIVLSISQNPDFGDYTTNIALQLAKQKSVKGKQSPVEIAKEIIDKLKSFDFAQDNFNKIEIAGPGFVNFFIKPEFLAEGLTEILQKGKSFGRNESGKGKKARVEFVSANPTGPLHFGNARGGPIGDVLSSVLEFCGWQVMREYLNNDRGNQILELGKTLAVRAGFISAPEEPLTYKGEYTTGLAERIKLELGEIKEVPEDITIAQIGELGAKIMLKEILKDCEDMGIKFDYVVHESELQKNAKKVLDELEVKMVLKRHEGAVWFAPKNEYLKDREAVVVKSDGNYTYFTADIVYHKEKFESGYDLVVDVLGSNTSGHVPKLQALAEVLGFDLAKFKVILYQFVRIKRGREVVRMSKRAGNFVTAREVLEEIGKDALRFFILMFDASTHMDFDLELAKAQSNKNPVYYVQYAHARMSNILKKEGSWTSQDDKSEAGMTEANYRLLTAPEELNLIRYLEKFPELVEELGGSYQVQKLTTYAVALANLFHKFYETHRVLNAESEELVAARLGLVEATKTVLANTLGLMGVTAPERM